MFKEIVANGLTAKGQSIGRITKPAVDTAITAATMGIGLAGAGAKAATAAASTKAAAAGATPAVTKAAVSMARSNSLMSSLKIGGVLTGNPAVAYIAALTQQKQDTQNNIDNLINKENPKDIVSAIRKNTSETKSFYKEASKGNLEDTKNLI